MDPQLSGNTASRERLLVRLPEALGEPLDASQQTAIRHLFSLDTVRTLEQRSNDHDVLLALSGQVRQRLGVESFWARVMDGLLFIDEDHWDYQAKQKTCAGLDRRRRVDRLPPGRHDENRVRCACILRVARSVQFSRLSVPVAFSIPIAARRAQ